MAGRFKLRKTGSGGSTLRGGDVLRGKTIFDPTPPKTFPPNAEVGETEEKQGFAKLKKRPK